MVTEQASLEIQAGKEEKFVSEFPGAADLLLGSEGCQSVQLLRGVESSSRFILLVQWDSLEAHVQKFFGSERYREFMDVVTPFLAQSPVVEHYETKFRAPA
jgi:heme-degrading monooxygenase HmoA